MLNRVSRTIAPAALAVALGALSPDFASSAGAEPAPTLAQAYNMAGDDLFHGLADEPGNIALSPYGVGAAMAMALAGARGDTRDEMGKVLRLGTDPSAIGAENAELMKALDEASRAPDATTKLTSANALMVLKTNKAVAADYRAMLATNFGAEIFDKPELAAINQWIETKTDGKIKNMLKGLDSKTSALLVNAVYFKARWEAVFEARSTRDDSFQLTKASKVETPTMHATGAYHVVARSGYRAIRLPFATPSFGMIIALPDAVDGVDALARCGSEEWAQLFAALREDRDATSVALSLPRFRIQYRTDLTKPFQNAGMRLAFQRAADFSGIFGASDAKGAFALGSILHQATVEVTEDGAEAAAATIIGLGHSFHRTKSAPEAFRIDHPFLFFIVDEGTGAVLFQGRVLDPRR